MVRIIVLSLVLTLAGCATVKPYPVCFYDPRSPDEQTVTKYVAVLIDRIVMEAPDANPKTDGRWIYAKTTSYQHGLISSTWPRVACIGTVTSGTEVKRYADCVSYTEALLRKNNYLELDVKPNAIDSDEAPGVEHVICSRVP